MSQKRHAIALVVVLTACWLAAPVPSLATEFKLTDYVETLPQPRRVQLHDMNGDGLLDIVATHSNIFETVGEENRLTVMLATGDGSTFDAPVATPIPMTNEGNFVVIDVDDDGILDVVTSSGKQPVLLHFRGLGNGQFEDAAVITLDEAAHWLVADDTNGDGLPDVVISGVFGFVRLLLNDGEGGFEPPASTASVGFSGGPMVTGDLDGDGSPDLALADTAGGTVALLFNDGEGMLSSSQFISVEAQSLDGVAVGDVDGDGMADIVVSGTGVTEPGLWPQQQGLWTLINTGSGQFAEPVVDEMFNVRDIVLADLDGDGHLDVAGHVIGSNVAIRLNDGEGGWHPRRNWNTTWTPTDLAVGDLNGDGRPDLVTPASGQQDVGDFALIFNLGGGEFAAREDYHLPGVTSELAIEDLDGDGVLDVVAGLEQAGPNALAFLPGDGDKGVVLPPVLSDELGSFGSINPGAPALADFNGDGDPDIVVAIDGTPNGAFVADGDGSGQFDVANMIELSTTGRASGAVVADFNRSGRMDVAVTNSSIGNSSLSLFSNFGGGSWGSEQRFDTQGAPFFPVVGDLDGDGWPDVVAGNQTTTVLSIFRNNQQGEFEVETLDVGGNLWHLQLIDFNDDGAPDLLFSLVQSENNALLARAAIMLNDGDGNFGEPLIQESGSTLAVRAGDLDGDGMLDLVGIGGPGLFTFYRGLGNADFELPVSRRGADSSGGGDLRIVDLDGNGEPEVVSLSGFTLAVYVQGQFDLEVIFSDGFE